MWRTVANRAEPLRIPSIARGAAGALGLALLAACAAEEPPLPPNQVRTVSGIVEGVDAAQPGVLVFRGIPYAAPPVGDLRWAPPQPAASWEGVRSGAEFGDRCVQTTPFPDMLFQSPAESEDCLSLSIWTTAAGDPDAALPVMVWIHGGGFFSGAGDEKRHDGSVLAAKGVVLVDINYRLGVLGFLAHPELTAESATGASGNYGLLDQIAALEWVRDNIAAFGGDPGNVTIFGESAGSFSVSALMASPLAAGLFDKAIGQSGSFLGSTVLSTRTLEQAEEAGADLAAAAGASSLAELRAVSAADLVATAIETSKRFGPILDGHVLAELATETFARGAQNDVPLIAGWNSAELKLPPLPAQAFTNRLEATFEDPEDLAAARELYPAGDDRERHLSDIALASDTFIGYSTWKWIEAQAATGDSPVYRYLFDQVRPPETGEPDPDDPGAAHASDIEYTFVTLDSRAGDLAWTEADRRVADLMSSYWTNFAKTGDPNGEGLPGWPIWDGSRRILRIDADPAAEPEPHRDRYELLDRVAGRVGAE